MRTHIKDTVWVGSVQGYVNVDHDVHIEKSTIVREWLDGYVRYNVFFGDVHIGAIEGFMHVYSKTVGRIRWDNKPRKAWRDVRDEHRLYHDTRKEVIAKILAEHLAKNYPDLVRKPAR